jgi:hypothetical protein
MTTSASDTVRLEWERRVAAEYAVCLLAQDFAQRLTVFAGPPELIEGALWMALDELEHARFAQRVCKAAGSGGAVTFQPQAFAVDASPDPIMHIAAIAVPNLCLGETLALRIVNRFNDNADVAVVCEALERVVGDEPRHVALGWATLDWLLELPTGGAVRDAIQRDLPRWFTSLRDSFAGPIVEPHLIEVAPADIAWGLASANVQREVFEETIQRDWIPRLARRGLQLC